MYKVTHVFDTIRPGGGPAGYLYNLSQAIASLGSDTIEIYANRWLDKRSSKGNVTKKPCRWIPAWVRWQYEYLRRSSKMQAKRGVSLWLKNLQEKSVLIFHATPLCATYLNSGIKPASQKVYLMSHCPVCPSQEHWDSFEAKYGNSFLSKSIRKKMLILDENTFETVDGIIGPDIESYHLYTATNQRMADAIKRNFHKVITGASPVISTYTKSEAKKALGLDPSKTTVAYFGRYHEHKGADIFKSIAKSSTLKDIQWFSAGSGTIDMTSDPIINIGWQTDIPRLLSAMDILIAPNRFSYFDLATIEALSMGIPVITSNVGGGLVFEKIGNAVKTFDLNNSQSVYPLIRQFADNISEMSSEAKKMYDDNFSLPQFLRHHERLAKELLKESSLS